MKQMLGCLRDLVKNNANNMQPGNPQPPASLIFQCSVSVNWIQKYTQHFQTLLKVSKTLRKTNEIVQGHCCFIRSTFPHPQLNVSECRLVLMGRMLSMTPERKCSWKSLSSESNGGIFFCLTWYLQFFQSSARAEHLPCRVELGPAGLQNLRTAGLTCLDFQTSMPNFLWWVIFTFEGVPQLKDKK